MPYLETILNQLEHCIKRRRVDDFYARRSEHPAYKAIAEHAARMRVEHVKAEALIRGSPTTEELEASQAVCANLLETLNALSKSALENEDFIAMHTKYDKEMKDTEEHLHDMSYLDDDQRAAIMKQLNL